MKRRDFLAFLGAGVAAGARPSLLWPRSAARSEPYLIERWSWAMGQPVHLLLFHPDESAGLEAAQAALAELRRVEARLSRFDDASDLSELNRRAGRGPMRADRDLLGVLEAAARFRRGTGGAFDIAVEPLMRVWGFRDSRCAPPGSAELEEARAAVRSAVIRIDGDRVELPAAHTRLDLGGIGVGYGLDRAGAVLRSHGVDAALLDVSGDLLALDPPPGSDGWPVDIVDPRAPGAVLARTLLRNRGLATSGNPAPRGDADATPGHVLDPRSGRPARRLRQATVVATSALAADVLSTGMLVGGVAPAGVERSWAVPG